jgi:sugar phosphate permease
MPKASRMRVVLAAILFFTLLVSYLDRVNVSVLVADPKFLADMGIAGQPAQMGLLLTTFLYAYGLSNLFVAPIGDWLGPRKAMSLSILLWGVSIAIGGLASTFMMMLAARILLGVGEGLHWPMQSSFVKNWFPPAERGKANSAWLLGIMVGPMLSIPLITVLVQSSGWRFSFAVLCALSFLPLALIWFFAADKPSQSGFVNAAELEHIESGLRAEREKAAEAAAAGQSSVARGFLADYRFWLVTIAFMCSASMFWGTMAWLPSYLKNARNFAWKEMGSLATLPYVLGAVTIVVFGVIADRTARKAIFPTIALFGAATCIYMGATVSDNVTSAYFMSAAIGFIGVGLASYWTIMQNIVETRTVGSAAGVMNGVASFGSAGVPFVIGYLIEKTGGNYTAGLLFLVILGALGGVCALALAARRF